MKHAAPADQTPAPASSPETTARRRFSAPKIIGIVAGSIVGLLLIAYVAGSLYFTDRFMPNTVLGDHDVSLKTSSEVQAILDDALSDYTVAVSGQGFSMKLSAKDAGVSFDGQAIVADALGNTNPWLWPLEITREHDETDSLAASSGSSLANAVRTAVDEFNATATPPTDAVVAFDEQKNAFAVQPDSGPGLVFVTLPSVFNQMPPGQLWGALFFVFMSFAALSTIIAVFENLITFTMEKWDLDRKRALARTAVLVTVLSLPCALGFNVLAGITIPGIGDIQSIEDFIVSNNLLPLGSLLYVVFCVSRKGWGWDNFLAEADAGTGMKFPRWARGWLTFGLPALIIIIFIMGYVPKIMMWAGLA